VILVGEIRDKETASIAVQASLTGHLVLTTMHTIDAVSSIARLLDIGVESYKLAAAVKGVVAQRLLRRLCHHCRVPMSEGVADRYQRWLPEGLALYRAAGCSECANTGFRGRMAIMEVMITTPEVEAAIAANESAETIVEAARQGGMKTLWDAGIAHVRAGETSLDELLRVVEPPLEMPGRRAEPAPIRARRLPTGGNGSRLAASAAPQRVATPRSAPGPFTVRPSMTMLPCVGVMKPAMAASSVDLPQPLGPSTQRNSLAATRRSTPSTARCDAPVSGLT
jgi:hypothetical protein